MSLAFRTVLAAPRFFVFVSVIVFFDMVKVFMVFKHDCTSAVALVHVGCGFRNFCREHLVRNTRKHMFNMLFFTHDIRASWHFGGWI